LNFETSLKEFRILTLDDDIEDYEDIAQISSDEVIVVYDSNNLTIYIIVMKMPIHLKRI